MRLTVICALSGSTLYFLLMSQTARATGKFREHKIYVLISSTTFPRNIFFILRRTARDIFINVQRYSVKYRLFLSDFNEA